MKKRFPLSSKNQKGQSLVELGISLMLILWLLAAAVDFGMGFFSFVAIRDAAQEGALYGSICQNTSNIVSRVHSSSTRPVNLTTVTVAVATPSGTSRGKPLTVTVRYNYPVSTPLISTFIGGATIPLTATATSTIIKSSTTCP